MHDIVIERTMANKPKRTCMPVQTPLGWYMIDTTVETRDERWHKKDTELAMLMFFLIFLPCALRVISSFIAT